MSRHSLAAGLIISVAYAAVHIVFGDTTLLTGAAPLRLSVHNYLGNVLASGMVWGIFSYLAGKAFPGRWLKALLSGPVLGLAGAASARFRWFDLFAALGFFLEPVITAQVPSSSYLPHTTTIPGYFAAATLWLIGAGFLIWQRRARPKAQQD